MSVVNQGNFKILLPRKGVDALLRTVMEHYAGKDQERWRLLAMLALHESADWPLDYVGLAFGHPRGHVSRLLTQVKRELRRRFRAEEGPVPNGK